MYYFIVNKTAGNGKGFRVWNKTERLLRDRKVLFKFSFTEYKGHANKLIENINDKAIIAIIVIGGDGTVHEVVSGLVQKEVALGIIPAGSGNDLARSLGVPFDVEMAVERILSGDVRPIDVPKVGGRHYISIAGLGFDGMVAQATNQSKSKRYLNKLGLGGMSYVMNIFKVLLTYKPSTASIVVDGKMREFKDVWLIAVANMPYYGGGIKICPSAEGDDGQLDICVVSGIGRWELLFVFPLAFNGRHVAHRNVTMLRGCAVQIHSKKPLVMQCDGEVIENEKADFKVEKKALNVL